MNVAAKRLVSWVYIRQPTWPTAAVCGHEWLGRPYQGHPRLLSIKRVLVGLGLSNLAPGPEGVIAL